MIAFIRAQMPEDKELIRRFFQHMRDFDTANPNCHFEIMIEAPDVTLAEALEMMKVNPKLTFTQIFERKR